MSAAPQALATLATEVWEALLERDPFTASNAGVRVKRLPRGDLAEADAVAGSARERLRRLEAIDQESLAADDRLTADYLRYWLQDETREPQRWWTGFGVAPYSASGFSILLGMLFPPVDLTVSGEDDRYVALASSYAEAIEALRERIEAQAERGWRLPQAALPSSRLTLERIGTAAAAAFRLGDDRGAPESLRSEVDSIINDSLLPAVQALLAAIGENYETAAPVGPGICCQPGGDEAYRDWIRYHLSFDVSPLEIHETGLAEVERLAAEMAVVRSAEFRFEGSEAEFHEQLRRDPRAKVASAEELERRFNRHLERMVPVFSRQFRRGPVARPAVKRLAPELEAGMTFGYYMPPTAPGADGIYHYSGNGIPDRLQMNAAPLIFHELVPGHHVHIARQAENEGLPELRRRTFAFGAFNEGWAEYSAGLADEAGLYDDRYDHYGWLSHQRFVAQRLVVDTGLNHFGWPLEEARAYMSANTLEAPEQVASETLRYSTDMPGQSLCYRMGFLKFRELRRQAQNRLGDAFDLADFHEAILEAGALPLSLLEQSLEGWASERLHAHV